MEEQVKSLLAEGENEQTKFFLNTDNREDLARTLTALANTKGGYILIGVRKNGKVAGIEPSESYSSLMESSSELCLPAVELAINTIQFDHKIMMLVNVPKSQTLHKVIENDELNLYIRYHENSIKTNQVLQKFLELGLENRTISVDLSTEESTILELLANNKEISMTQLAKKVDIKRDYLENLLAHLLYKKYITYKVEGEKITFTVAI